MTHTNPRKESGTSEPAKIPHVLPPVDPEELIQPASDPEYIIPDDEEDTTPPYEQPEPGEGP